MERNLKIDSLKGLLIFFVVLGHAMDIKDYNIGHPFYEFMLSFDMPLFIIISGYFTSVKDNKRFFKSFINLLLIYYTIQIYAVIGGYIHWHTLYYIFPFFQLWYIFALLEWRLFAHCFKIHKANPYIMIGVSIILGLIVGFFPQINYPFTAHRFIAFMPYFLIGFYASKIKDIQQHLPQSRKIWGCVLALSLLAFFLIPRDPEFYHILLYARPYEQVSDNLMIGCMYRMALYCVSIPISISIIKVSRPIKPLYLLGNASMSVYLLHGFIIVSCKEYMINHNISNSMLLSLVLSIIITTILYYFDKTKFCKFIINPIDYIFKYINNKK